MPEEPFGEYVLGEYVLGGEGVGGGTGPPLPTSNELGRADSGQLWFGSNGWSIEESENRSALMGMSTILPIFHAEDNNSRTGQGIPSSQTAGHPAVFGLTGKDTEGIVLYVDRPTRLLAFGFGNYSNESAVTAVNVRFYLPMTVNDTDFYIGRQTNAYSTTEDPGHRLCATSHELFIDAAEDDIHKVEIQWGFYQDSAAFRTATIRNLKMEFILAYAPDYSKFFTTKKRPKWSDIGVTRQSYRRAAGDDI